MASTITTPSVGLTSSGSSHTLSNGTILNARDLARMPLADLVTQFPDPPKAKPRPRNAPKKSAKPAKDISKRRSVVVADRDELQVVASQDRRMTTTAVTTLSNSGSSGSLSSSSGSPLSSTWTTKDGSMSPPTHHHHRSVTQSGLISPTTPHLAPAGFARSVSMGDNVSSYATEKISMEMVLRGCRGQLNTNEIQAMCTGLLQLDKMEAQKFLEKAYKDSNSQGAPKKGMIKGVMSMVKGKSEEAVSVSISKTYLDFGYGKDRPCPLNKELTEEITLTNLCQAKAKFNFWTIPKRTHTITFTPSNGIIKKKSVQSVKVSLIIRTTIKLEEVVTLEIEDGTRFFIVIKLMSEKSVFGVPTSEMDTVEDGGVQIPAVLVTMKNYLYEHGGISQEGVFRLAGDEAETASVKEHLNRGTFVECRDINCIANLIKVWFREMPTHILNMLPKDAFLNSEEEEDCVRLFNTLPQQEKTLLTWLLGMLADVASLESVNKMNPRALAIVVAPNLFSAAEASPAESLTLSGKVVNFVNQLLNFKLRQRPS